MTRFSSEWLRLREDADAHARNGEISSAVAARFALRESISVVDLGCGTGANLRMTSALLPQRQSWLLIDIDVDLLATARRSLAAWADSAEATSDGLLLKKGYTEIDIRFSTIDLAQDMTTGFSATLDGHPGLVTASAFFDLVSEEFIRRLVSRCADVRAAFYSVLSCNGVVKWSPHRPSDNQIASAFHRHHLGDKGFGPAAGPMAASLLADQFKLHDYSVLEGESRWRLGRNDRTLVEELVRGHAVAAGETGLVDNKTLEAWVKVQRTGAEVGHTDTFAAPV